ncbi:MAG: LPS export ABC transporter permease LptG [Pseudomonadota bacterium]|nr:LPS export ABC transporter permease LptG [Pseudomonadota bacterium]
MNLLNRYIAVTILKSVAIVIFVLIAVGTFIDFMAQLSDVGTAQYDLRTAAAYAALRIPRMVFQLLPAAALIGALLGLGNLAVHRELVVMRASGISKLRLMGPVAIAGFVLMVIMAVLGESLAPSLGAYAREVRAAAMLDTEELADGSSTWLKDGDHIVNFRREPNGLGFGGVYLFELDEDNGLRQISHADTADIDLNNQWILGNYSETVFYGLEGVQADSERRAIKDYGLSSELLDLSVVRHDLLNTGGLIRYIDYLEANDLDATQHLIAYWARMADIVSVLLMSVLALPFVFGGLRSAGTSARLLVGLLIGLTYYVTAQAFANSGQVFDFDPRVVAWLPSGVLLLITTFALVRSR